MDQEFNHWQVESLPLRIEYSPAVMEELRVYGEEGFQKIPHGGIEVGALLLGDRDGQTVRIREWRPLQCDHARGPGFVLSPADREALAAQLEVCAKAPELQGLSVVGWFHTHTRSKIFLSSEDLAIHEAHFAEPWQVALVLRPQKDQAPSAGFFCKDSEGKLNGEFSPAEFIVKPDPLQGMKPKRKSAALVGGVAAGGSGAAGRIMSGRPEVVSSSSEALVRRERPMFRTLGEPRVPAGIADRAGEQTIPAEPPPFTLSPPRSALQRRGPAELMPLEPPPLPPPPVPARFPAGWVVAALVTIVALVTGFQFWRTSQNLRTAQLKVEEADQSLQISWDKAAVGSADRAVLRLVDGTTVRTVPLSQTAVRHGSVTYLRQADDVEVRLTLYHGNQQGAQMFARYVGAPASASVANGSGPDGAAYAAPSERRLQLQTDVARLRAALQAEADRAERLREELVLLEKTSGGAPLRGRR